MKQLESFFWGIIAALGALVIELIVFIFFSGLTNQPTNFSFATLFAIPQFIILAACIEEAFKYIVISKRIELLSLRRSYLINSFFVGLGFFGIELGMAAMTSSLPEAKLLAEIAIIHLGTAGIIGYIVATRNPKKISTFLIALLAATFFHSAYNLLIMNRAFVINYAIFIMLFFMIIINVFNLIRINSRLAQD